jgi:hypothetical protein
MLLSCGGVLDTANNGNAQCSIDWVGVDTSSLSGFLLACDGVLTQPNANVRCDSFWQLVDAGQLDTVSDSLLFVNCEGTISSFGGFNVPRCDVPFSSLTAAQIINDGSGGGTGECVPDFSTTQIDPVYATQFFGAGFVLFVVPFFAAWGVKQLLNLVKSF